MLTVLLIGAGRSVPKKAAAIVISCIPRIFLHFPGTAVRAADLAATGIAISLIYLLSKNLVYCIAFHMAANCVTMPALPASRWLFSNEWLVFVGIGFAAVCLPLALVKMNSKGKCVSFQPMSSLLTA